MSDSTNSGQLSVPVDDDFLLDDIEDIPGFAIPPSGAYSVVLEKGIEIKDINDSSYYEIALTLKELLEVNEKSLDDGEEMPVIGSIASMIFKRDNKFGMSNFKKFARSIAEKFQLKTITEIRAASKGLDMIVVIKRKHDKKADVHRMEIIKAQVI